MIEFFLFAYIVLLKSRSVCWLYFLSLYLATIVNDLHFNNDFEFVTNWLGWTGNRYKFIY